MRIFCYLWELFLYLIKSIISKTVFFKPPESSYGSSYRANQSSRPDFSTSYGTPRQNYASSGAYRTDNRFNTNYSSTSR